MKIKGHEFGKGKPVVCVPVVEQSAEGIKSFIEAMTKQNVEMIEWRMDWYEEIGNLAATERLLREISAYTADTVLLCTFRSKKQGGEREITQEEYLTLNRTVAESGVADLIDVEFFEVDGPQKVITELQRVGVKVICSNHNFQQTPDTKEMEQQLAEMLKTGADFAKLAVMPEEKKDVLRLMEAVLNVKEQYTTHHVIAMSMGMDGVISRLLGSWYQSEVTFAAFGKASAPGQVLYQQVKEILNQIEECVGE